MTNRFNFANNIIYKDGECFLSFLSNIQTILVLDKYIVILVKYSTGNNQNIYCYDLQKNRKWQIPKPVALHSENYFSALYLRDSEIYAYNINGVEYHLDKDTGNILGTELIK